ncbi:hypothetical protein F5Y07DRAFT_411032 [Xylaria sp. FL0933]|nr:hypothetical protein F5Y07DRAFT_411032 [Xylaria sp. FL0933]
MNAAIEIPIRCISQRLPTQTMKGSRRLLRVTMVTMRRTNAKKETIVKPEGTLGRTLVPKSLPKEKTQPVPEETIPVKKAPSADKYDKAIRSSYTYLQFAARPTPTGEDIKVCGDPGTGRTIIGRSYLNTLEHTTEERHGTVECVSDQKVQITTWAKFKFYTAGVNADGKPLIIEHKKKGWVVDNHLQPGIAVIDYRNKTITFQGLDGFTIHFEVMVRSRECVRRVVNKRDITLQGGEKAYVQVDYKPLPADRSFCFMAIQSNSLSTVLDAKTPQVVPVINTATTPVKIHKGTKLGQIPAIKTLAVAAAALATPLATMISSGNADTANSAIAVNAEFDMSPMITATATDTAPEPETAVYMDELANPAPLTVAPTVTGDHNLDTGQSPLANKGLSDTPLTDVVFNIISETNEIPAGNLYALILEEGPKKPKLEN